MTSVIALDAIHRHYRMGGETVKALRDVSLVVERGEYVVITGPSGSGKSTLMNLLGCLDRPTSGRYLLDGRDVSSLDDDAMADVRNRKLGFVFQQFHLLPSATAQENVELPLIYAGCGATERRRRAQVALERVGLAARAHHLPSQLSGGQQQRVAIARAVVGKPAILLADEPTGNLDSHNSREVMRLLRDLHADDTTIVLVTHDPDVAAFAQRTIVIHDGTIASDRHATAVANGAGVAAPLLGGGT